MAKAKAPDQNQHPGITEQEDGRWNVDKWHCGERIRQKGFASLKEAQDWVIEKQAVINARKKKGDPGKTIFAVAAETYLQRFADKPSLDSDIAYLDAVMPFIGNLTLEQIYDENMQEFIAHRKSGRWSGKTVKNGKEYPGKWIPKGVKNSTINHSIDLVEQILTLCATKWRNKDGHYWLDKAPKLSRLPLDDEENCRAIEWDEQRTFLAALPEHLRDMALFTLNSGVRDDVVCNLQWDWIEYIPELDMRVFIVPPQHVKGPKHLKSERLLVCNSLAWEIVDKQKGKHDKYVFTWKRGENWDPKPITEMCNTAWNTARERTGLKINPHDLRATVATRVGNTDVVPDVEAVVKAILWHGRSSVTEIYKKTMIRNVATALEAIKEETEYKNICSHTIIERHKARRAKQAKAQREAQLRPPAVSEESIQILDVTPTDARVSRWVKPDAEKAA